MDGVTKGRFQVGIQRPDDIGQIIGHHPITREGLPGLGFGRPGLLQGFLELPNPGFHFRLAIHLSQ